MGSTFGGLNILVRGLAAQQTSLDTVGHNISNANTSGYSRQTVNLTTPSPQTIYGQNGAMQSGTGVSISSITRARDTFADKQMWKESSTLGYGQTTQGALSKIEGVFQEPSDTGVQTVLNQFWSAWQTLATNASDDGARTAVRQRGVEVVNAIQHADQQLKDMASDINSEIDINVKSINQTTSEIYSLNKQIANIEAGGTDHANDLRDRRDLLVDQLSSMVNVNVSEDKYGNYNVQSSGVTLVDGNGYTKLDTTNPAPDATYGYSQKQVIIANTNTVVNFTNGKIKGLIDARDSSTTGVKGYIDNLEKVSQFLLQDFNDVHRTGFGTDNSTGNNFFGDNTTNYSTDPAPTSWISALTSPVDKLNPDLFGTGGLAKIAAKTSTNSIAVTKDNASASLASVTATGIYTGGTSTTSVQVKVDASNNVTYSTDGTTWNSLTSPYTFSVKGLTVNVTIPGGAAGTTYTFSLSQGNNASGDNAVNLSNSLKTDISPIFQTSLDSFYSSFIGALGVQSQDAKRLTDNQQTLVDQITNLRESTAGVNMDEEMTNMIRFQKGYNAAARVLTSMDEMLDKLINSTGTVGR